MNKQNEYQSRSGFRPGRLPGDREWIRGEAGGFSTGRFRL